MFARCKRCSELTNQPITEWKINGKLVMDGPICQKCYTLIYPKIEEYEADKSSATKNGGNDEG